MAPVRLTRVAQPTARVPRRIRCRERPSRGSTICQPCRRLLMPGSSTAWRETWREGPADACAGSDRWSSPRCSFCAGPPLALLSILWCSHARRARPATPPPPLLLRSAVVPARTRRLGTAPSPQPNRHRWRTAQTSRWNRPPPHTFGLCRPPPRVSRRQPPQVETISPRREDQDEQFSEKTAIKCLTERHWG